MSQPLHSLCNALKYNILSIDRLNGVKLNYKGQIVTIPYEKWKKIEYLVLSFFDFTVEKTLHEITFLSSK
ncbi:MAG TPA: hypothetical protein IAB62_04490 [Candidatus Coprocola pullicola]|nr:hypothetical protein [Candidatus Coprocola pullicola]